MKKLIIAILMMVSGGAAMAQDFQFHYDFGRNLYGTEESSRARTTLTYEQFKADRLGSWYWFVDFDLYGAFYPYFGKGLAIVAEKAPVLKAGCGDPVAGFKLDSKAVDYFVGVTNGGVDYFRLAVVIDLDRFYS